MGPKQFPIIFCTKATNYCKFTNFRCFKNRTITHGCKLSFHDALKFVVFNFRRKDTKLFGNNKKYLNITISTLFWTCLSFLSIFPTRLNKPLSRFSILDPRFSIPDSRFSILHSRFSILDPRSTILDPRFPLLDSRFSILDPRSPILDSRLSVLNSRGSMFLDSLFLILDIRTSFHKSR